MKLQKGFTLAEVLVTLGLIGVVASMTMPALNVNIQKQQVGPSLAKAINSLEAVNKTILTENNARSLKSICGTNDYLACIEPYINGSYYNSKTVKYYSADFTHYAGTYNKGEGLSSKDGITYYVTAGINERLASRNPKYNGEYYTLTIDTNGFNKKPNMMNRDLFKVYVDAGGAVIPYGGYEYNELLGKAAGTAAEWESKCSTSVFTGRSWSCAGSIVDNGFKVIYKY